MKKIDLRIVSLYLSALFVFSCTKTDIQEGMGLEIGTLVLPEGQVLEMNPVNILNYLSNNDDPDDEKIKKQRYELGLIARKLFHDNTYNEVLINYALTSANTAVCLNWFVNISTQLKAGYNFNQEIFSELQMTLDKIDFSRNSSNPLKQDFIEEYFPALFLVNPETADFNKKPFICPGIEVNSGIPGLEKFDDYIVAWFSDDKGNFYELLIDENFAMTTNHPIFSIDNAEYEISQRTMDQDPNAKSDFMTKNEQTARYYTHEFRINHRYERNSPSEFTITAARIDQNGGIHTPLRNSNGTVTLEKKIADVPRGDIGKDLGKWVQFCNEAPIPFDKNFIFFNTYERDWWASDKSLGGATRNGKTIFLSGRRTYSSEWYAYDPGVLNNNPIDLYTLYNSWSELHANAKGYLRFWRVHL